MANTAVGEIAVIVSGQSYLLRPSFYNIQQIGEPHEIAEAAEYCISAKVRMMEGLAPDPLELGACSMIIDCCSNEPIPVEVFGQVEPAETGVKWVEGIEPHQTLVGVAYGLIIGGMVGKPDKKRARMKSKGTPKPFDPLDYVGAIVAHLGLPIESAWQMTMIEYQRTFDAKFPLSEKEQSMMTADELRALRRKNKGLH